MTDSPSPHVPAAWYPDPAGGPSQRWWDGTQWTEHYQQPYTAAGAVLKAPEGTKPYTLWIWLIFAVMVLQLLPFFFTDYEAYLSQTITDDSSFARVSTTSDPLTVLAAWLGAALLVLFAYFDWRALKSAGVPRPFHWAWMFFAVITPLVYIIGRSVVVRRRTGSGIAPLWIGIGLTVLGWIITAIIVIPPTMRAFDEVFSRYPG